MNISMHILFQYLEAFGPKATVRNEKRDLQGIRLLADASMINPGNAYLSYTSNPSSKENTKLICTHGNDVIEFERGDIDEVFNRSLDCFDEFNKWESSCMRDIEEGCSLQELLDAAESLFDDDFYIADQSQFVRERVLKPVPARLSASQKKNLDFMTQMYENDTMPFENIAFVRNRLASRRFNLLEIAEFGEGYFPVIVRSLYNGSTYWGQLIENNIYTPASVRKMQLLDMLGDVVEHWLRFQAATEEQVDLYSRLIQRVSSGSAGAAAELGRTLENIGWDARCTKRVYAIKQRDGDIGLYPSLSYKLNTKASCVSGVIEDTLIAIRDTTSDDEQFKAGVFGSLISQGRFIACESYAFEDVESTRSQIDLLRAVLTYIEKAGMHRFDLLQANPLVSCSDYAIEYFFDRMLEAGVFFEHPGASAIINRDRKSRSSLGDTLFRFLLTGCNYQKTAAALHLHRNTIQHRVEQAIEISGLDVSDDMERLHMLFSLMARIRDKEPPSDEGPSEGALIAARR